MKRSRIRVGLPRARGWSVLGWVVLVLPVLGAEAPKAYRLQIKHSQDPIGMTAWVQGDRFRLERTRGGKKIAEIYDGTSLIRQWDGYASALRLPGAGASGLMLWKPAANAGGRSMIQQSLETVASVPCQVHSIVMPAGRGGTATLKEWVDGGRGLVLKRVSPSPRGEAVIEVSSVEDLAVVDPKWFQPREGVKVVNPLAKGQPLPLALELPRADGGDPVKLGDLVGKKAFVLNFFGTWCQPCVKEIPGFVQVYKEYQGKELEIISIDAGEHNQDPKKVVPPFMKKHEMTWPVVLDEGGWAMDFFLPGSSVALPTNIFVSKEGVVKEVAAGGLSEAQFQGLVKRLAGSAAANPFPTDPE